MLVKIFFKYCIFYSRGYLGCPQPIIQQFYHSLLSYVLYTPSLLHALNPVFASSHIGELLNFNVPGSFAVIER